MKTEHTSRRRARLIDRSGGFDFLLVAQSPIPVPRPGEMRIEALRPGVAGWRLRIRVTCLPDSARGGGPPRDARSSPLQRGSNDPRFQ